MWNRNFVLMLVGLGVASYFLPTGMPAWCWAVWYVFCFAAGVALAWHNLNRLKENDNGHDEEY